MSEQQRTSMTIASEDDVVSAREKARELTSQLGGSAVLRTQVATVVSELTRNILLYAGGGRLTLVQVLDSQGRPGVEVIAEDEGPGITDLELVMQDGYSSSQGLGLGLPGTKRLMDHFEITSTPGRGTSVRALKWWTRR